MRKSSTRKPRHTEDAIQKAIIDTAKWLRINRPGSEAHGKKIIDYLCAIPNGGKRDVREAARLKSQGVKAGMPDLFFFVPTRDYHGLFVELKRPKTPEHRAGTVSESQEEILARLAGVNYCTTVCYSEKETLDKIEWYLSLP